MPEIGEKADITFGDVIKLEGYDHVVSEDTLNLVLYWQAQEEGLENYYHFVHLIDPISGEIMAQHDSMPRFDTYPTSQWSMGEVVFDPAVFDLSKIPPGSYQLAIGLYEDLGLSAQRCKRRSMRAGQNKPQKTTFRIDQDLNPRVGMVNPSYSSGR
jgi:hypothetical protein